jgi:guanylate kinase
MERFDVPKDSSSQQGNFHVVVLSGPSGSGKSTIVNRLIESASVPLMKVVSATTRPPRSGEKDGIDYTFLSQQDFDQRRNNGDFLEFAEVHGSGYWYGTLKSEIERSRASGQWAFLEIDVQGALNVMKAYPEAITFFLTTPSESEYEKRLRHRGTESEDVIELRLETARRELQLADQYRYCIVNDDLDQAVNEISVILSDL